MATLVLGTVGTLVGGPLGGALGSLVGNGLDRALVGSKRLQGPRLTDLHVQTSSYGTQIPQLFGTLRVAGTVIWATDLREDKHGSGGGKAGRTVSYSYSASFAVAISSRPIVKVGRIWADGNLLRGAAGDWKAQTGFRLYPGSEDQPIDPLIAAAEGIGATPAHRGLAYAVFENLQLANFGNRVPSITLEVVADAGPVTAPGIAQAISDGVMTGDGGTPLTGFAASGENLRNALESLTRICPLSLVDDGGALRINDGTAGAIDPQWLGAGAESRSARHVRDRRDAGALPDAVALSYYEPARDFQAGLQRARRDGVGRREIALDLPAAVSADVARALAEDALGRAWLERDTAVVRVPWRSLDLRVGTLVRLDGADWRITGWSFEHMVVELSLRRAGDASSTTIPADAGRALPSPDEMAGRTVLVPMDLPTLDDTLATRPGLWLAAAGTGSGWRSAAVSLSLDGGTSWQALGQTALPAVIGSAVTPLGGGSANSFDRISQVEVDLLNPGMALQGATDDALVDGANLVLIGDELVQFGSAEQIGVTRWRLSRLVRGRRGTEWSMALHRPGERFVLLDRAALLLLDVPLAALGATALLSAIGPGDDGVAAEAATPVVGAAVRPPTPVHLIGTRRPGGDILFAWTRRSRQGWAWLDGGDAPVGEDAERYRLTIRAAGGVARVVETTTSGFTYDVGQQRADGAADAPGVDVSLVMLGTSGASVPPVTAGWIW